MNSDQLVCCIRVPSKNKAGFYRIKTVWREQEFHLTVLDDLQSFRTNVSQDDLKLLSIKYERNLHEYIQLLKGSISELNCAFIYNRQDNLFYIYKQEKAVTIQLADFILETINYNDAVTEFIDEISILADKYKKQILNYKTETLKAIEEKEYFAQKIENYINEKQNSEHDLYSKFILLLNEKKTRIQYLQELLESFESGKTIKINGNQLKVEQKSTTNRLETISDTETDSSDNESVQITHKVQIETTPKKKLDFFDDDDDQSIYAIPKRVKMLPASKDLDEIITETIPDNLISIRPEANHLRITEPEGNKLDIPEKKEDMKDTSNDSFEFSTQDLFDRL